ncbi:MAG: serine/threonine protein kinase [Elusimicrobia bacterium]|nr:serine/threonine protein kinase [Elusimicrobiota bacterium]
MSAETTVCTGCGNEVPRLRFCDQCGQTLAGGPSRQDKDTVAGDDSSLVAGRYLQVRRLGAGGMGVVYEALDKKLDKTVAIKKMRSELQIDPSLRRKFVEEARTVAKLHHHNIVDIYAVLAGKEDGLDDPDATYLVFEFLEGRSLKDIIGQGPLPLARAKKIGLQVCSALKYAHERKVAHRDLKPANLMIGPEDHVKVLDFGIARVVLDTMMSVTNTQDTSGTLPFMAPEQHLGKADGRADLFAFGVTFYEMVVGTLPFTGPDYLAQKERMVYGAPSKALPGLAEAVDAFVGGCLQPDREKRFPTAAETAAALEKIG